MQYLIFLMIIQLLFDSTSTHATELVLDSQGFSAMLDNSNGHVAQLKCFKHFKIEFESTTQNHLNGGQ